MKKIAIGETGQMEQRQSTFMSNLTSNAIAYLSSRYPWITGNISDIKWDPRYTESDSKYAVGVVKIKSGAASMEAPIVYYDGEILPVPAFYLADSDMMVPFNETYFRIIKDKLNAGNESFSTLSMAGQDAASQIDNIESTNSDNLQKALRVDGKSKRYSYAAGRMDVLSTLVRDVAKEVSPSRVARLLKKAANDPLLFPMTAPLASAYRLSQINRKGSSHGYFKKKAVRDRRRNRSVYIHKPFETGHVAPNPVIDSKIYSALPKNFMKTAGLSSKMVAYNLRKYSVSGLYTMDQFEVEVGNNISHNLPKDSNLLSYKDIVLSASRGVKFSQPLTFTIGTGSDSKPHVFIASAVLPFSILSGDERLEVAQRMLRSDMYGNDIVGEEELGGDRNRREAVTDEATEQGRLTVRGVLENINESPVANPSKYGGLTQAWETGAFRYVNGDIRKPKVFLYREATISQSYDVLKRIFNTPLTARTAHIMLFPAAKKWYEPYPDRNSRAGSPLLLSDGRRIYSVFSSRDETKDLMIDDIIAEVGRLKEGGKLPSDMDKRSHFDEYTIASSNSIKVTESSVKLDNVGTTRYAISIYTDIVVDGVRVKTTPRTILAVTYNESDPSKTPTKIQTYSSALKKMLTYKAKGNTTIYLSNAVCVHNTQSTSGLEETERLTIPVARKDDYSLSLLLPDVGEVSSSLMRHNAWQQEKVVSTYVMPYRAISSVLFSMLRDADPIDVQSLVANKNTPLLVIQNDVMADDMDENIVDVTLIVGKESDNLKTAGSNLQNILHGIGMTSKQANIILHKVAEASQPTTTVEMAPLQTQATAPSALLPTPVAGSKELGTDVMSLFGIIKDQITQIENNMKTQTDLVKQQLELTIKESTTDRDTQISALNDNIEEVGTQVEDIQKALQEVMAQMEQAQAPAEVPPEQGAEAGAEGDPSQPTIDMSTAQLLAQAAGDPAVAEQNGIDPTVVQGIQQYLETGDLTGVQHVGLNQADMDMIQQAQATMGEGGQALPPQQEGEPQTDPNDPQAGAAQMQEQAMTLVQALMDPNIAQQSGVTQEDLQYVQTILSDPDAAITNGEDPNMVTALIDAYNSLTTQQGADAAQQATVPPEQGQPEYSAAAEVPQAPEHINQPTVSATSILSDLIPKLKSSSVLRQHSEEFRSVLSLLGEMLFSLEVQSAKYKDQMGYKEFNNTITKLRNLYTDFGDMIAQLYTIN